MTRCSADRLWLCALITSISIYFHLGGYVTAPVGVAAAALMTGRWRPLVKVGVLTALMTAPFTWHFLRYREWYRGEHGAVAISFAPLIYVTALPGLLWLLRRPRTNVFLIAWVAAPIVWLAQDYSRFLTQATLPMAVIAGVCIASVSSRLWKRRPYCRRHATRGAVDSSVAAERTQPVRRARSVTSASSIHG